MGSLRGFRTLCTTSVGSSSAYVYVGLAVGTVRVICLYAIGLKGAAQIGTDGLPHFEFIKR